MFFCSYKLNQHPLLFLISCLCITSPEAPKSRNFVDLGTVNPFSGRNHLRWIFFGPLGSRLNGKETGLVGLPIKP